MGTIRNIFAASILAAAVLAVPGARAAEPVPATPSGESPGPGGPAASEPTTTPTDAHRAQLAAARADGIQSLKRNVLLAPFTGEMTIGQYATRLNGVDGLVQRLQGAMQRGGTRWRSDHTCEIMLEITGGEVADELDKIAGRDPLNRVLPAEELKGAIEQIRRQTYTAVGVSVSAENLAHLRPERPEGPWRRVSDSQRKEALATAKANAVARLIESLRSVDLGNGRRMDDAMDKPELIDTLRRWVADRPVTGVAFQDNLEVKVTLAATPEDLWPVVQSTLQKESVGPSADDVAGWDKVHRSVVREVAPAVGSGVASVDKADAAVEVALPRAEVKPFILPARAPFWATGDITIKASADGEMKDRLRTARLAESDALTVLRQRVEALPLADSTLGEISKRDPRVQQAITRTLERLPQGKAEYGPAGKATVRVVLPLEQLWNELSDLR